MPINSCHIEVVHIIFFFSIFIQNGRRAAILYDVSFFATVVSILNIFLSNFTDMFGTSKYTGTENLVKIKNKMADLWPFENR